MAKRKEKNEILDQGEERVYIEARYACIVVA